MKREIIITFIVMVISGTGLFGQLHWEKHIIDETLGKPEVVAIGDLNGDTKHDVVVNDLSQNKIILYINNFPTWDKHIIDANLDGAYVTDIGDIDGDGKLDIVASGYREKVVVWYENNYPTWNRHTIAESLTVSGAVSIADIDGDDTLDVISSGYREGGDLVWYENNHPNWPKHMIKSDYPVEWSCASDIDGDGAIDVAVARWDEGEVNWFRNENAGQSWNEISIDDSIAHASLLSFGDIDGDDDMDIAAVGEHESVVIWYENNHPNWEQHIIDTSLDYAWGVVVVDIDGDEKPDVAATSVDADIVVWYKNNHPEWEKNIIDANLDGADILLYADIDNDDALDLVVPGMFAGDLVWYRNPTNMAYAKSVTSNFDSSYLQPSGDTLFITAELVNPEQHPAIVHAHLRSVNISNQDSIQLFNDGLHDDNDPSDNIWGSGNWITNLEEDMFTVELSIKDLTTGTNYLYPNIAQFTTAGPVEWESYEIVQQNDSVYSMKVTLENNGSSLTVSDISALLSTNDSNISEIIYDLRYYLDIEPGHSVQNLGTYGYVFKLKNHSDPVNFTLDIYSDNIPYWTDSKLVNLVTDIKENKIASEKFSLSNNYPNPFNPSTTIKYQFPGQARNDNTLLILKVYDILGREVATLVNEKQKPGNYEVEFDGKDLTSGIYFYQLQTGKYLETKKMLMIK